MLDRYICQVAFLINLLLNVTKVEVGLVKTQFTDDDSRQSCSSRSRLVSDKEVWDVFCPRITLKLACLSIQLVVCEFRTAFTFAQWDLSPWWKGGILHIRYSQIYLSRTSIRHTSFEQKSGHSVRPQIEGTMVSELIPRVSCLEKANKKETKTTS